MKSDLSLSDRIPSEAVTLVEAAASTSLVLRITGSVAVRVKCEQHWPLLSQLGRRPYHDMDFWALSKDHNDIERFFSRHGYVEDPQCKHMREWGIKRLIFDHPESAMKVDVFMDELVMAHTIDFKSRLHLDSPCISLADLLLSKLQIHEITDNDLMDMLVLLLEHGGGPGPDLAGGPGPDLAGGPSQSELDLGRVGSVLAHDWGFWYEAMQNVVKLRASIERYEIVGDTKATLETRLAQLQDLIEGVPKDRRWRMRAKVGTRKRWYELVGDVDR